MGPPGKEGGGRGGRPPEASTAPAEIPYAVRWLVPRGERFANFDILNDNDTQLDYYRRFGHIYAVGIPARKWRLVVVSDPELLDEVAADEEQFGKRVEEINFFAQLANSRGGGLSVIGDGAALRADPPGDAALVLPGPPAHPAGPDEGPGGQAGRRVGRAAGRRAAGRARLDGALHPRGVRARRVRLRLRTPRQRRDQPRDRRRAPAPVRGGRPGEHQGEHHAGGRTPPRLHRVRRAHPAGAAQGVPPAQHRAVPDGRRAGPRPDAYLPARAADRLAQPAGEHAGPGDRRVPGRRDDPRPDPHAPVQRLQRPVDHGRVAGLRAGHEPGRGGEADRRDRRDHRRRPGLRPALRRPDGAAVHHRGDQGDDADLPADAGHHPAQPQGRDARPLPDQEGRHHPGRHARRAARPALLGPGTGPVRPGAVHHGQDRRPAAARLHPVLDREAAVHGAGGHVHDAPRRAVRGVPAVPAPARAGRDRGQERGGDDQAGRGPGHPGAARGDQARAGRAARDGHPAGGRGDRAGPFGPWPDAPAGASRRRSRRPAPTGTW